jgi:hypothetical protein
MGVANEWLVDAMAMLGWSMVEMSEYLPKRALRDRTQPFKRYSLGDFAQAPGNDGPFIVNVTGHYVAIGGGEICDTFTTLTLDIAGYRRRWGRWVQRWWKFARAEG